MSIPTLQSIISTNFLSVVNSGDPLAVMMAMEAAVANELSGAAITSSETTKKQMAELEALNNSHMLHKLDNLANALSPDDGSLLTKVDNDTAVAMSLSSSEHLQAQLASLGYSLASHVRAPVTIATIDKNGKETITAAKHLATPAEMAAAANGTKTNLVTGSDSYEISTLAADTSGTTTKYTFHLASAAGSLQVATASIADINSLKSTMAAKRTALFEAISAEATRLQSFSNHIIERVKAGQDIFQGRRKEDLKFAEKRQDAQMEEAEGSIEKNTLTRIRLRNLDKVRQDDRLTDPAPAVLAAQASSAAPPAAARPQETKEPRA
jgi:hypothetical protein